MSERVVRLRMQHVKKAFGPTVALADVSLHAAAGEVLGLVGENGAGKSTLMKILAGVHRPDAGEIELEGAPFAPCDPLVARKAGIAMIYQELALAPHLSVAENLVLGVEPGRGGMMDWRATRALAQKALETVGLGDIDSSLPISALSLAARQLVEIGRAVVVGCRVLVLDEPTSSLAQGDIARLFKLVAQLKQTGIAIIYISHFLEEIRALCDRVTVLRDGRSVCEGETKQFTDEQIVAQMVGRDVHELYPRSARTPGEAVLSVRDVQGEIKPHG